MRREFENKAPNDDEFKSKLETSDFKRNSKTLYILDYIEKHHYSSEGGGKTIDRANVDIEHIAPQRALSDKKYSAWKEVLNIEEGEYNNKYRNRLGNLTLLENWLNEEASDNPFQQKKDQYHLSDFRMTQEIREKI